MNYAALAAPCISVAGKFETIVNKFYERGDIVEDNRDELCRLVRRCKGALKLVEKLPKPNPIILERLNEFETTLQEQNAKLAEWEAKIEKARRKDRVKRMEAVLCKCKAFIQEFYDIVSEVSGELYPQPSPQDPPQTLQQTPDQDEYSACNTVPVNPPRLLLDYDTTTTCEGKLREAILSDARNRVVAVVASRKGGVGKTCALRGLADDREIQHMFPDGILYIQLGHDATISDIVKGIADVVEETGGLNLSKVIRAAESLATASKKARKWFSKYTCLFLVDDMWEMDKNDSDVLSTLGSMINAGSRMVYTTRDRRLLNGADKVIEFIEKDTFGSLSRRMLMNHAGFDEKCTLDQKNQDAFEGILEVCQGLPLAFGIAGSCVLKNSRRKSAELKQDAWFEFYSDILSRQEDILAASAMQYGQVSRIVDVSLHVLGRESSEEMCCEKFRRFCVVQKQQSVPIYMLQRLWGMKHCSDAKRVVEKFEEVSLVQVRREGDCLYVQLHDLILDIAVRHATKQLELQESYRTLYRNYIPTRRRNDKEHEWWTYEDDGYIHNNVCRILRGSGYIDELFWLLSRPQWIAKRLLTDGINLVEQDVRVGEAAALDDASAQGERKTHLEMIRGAARLSSHIVAKNGREVWFQLHGRLLSHARQCKLTRDFVRRVEECAPRPWLKASEGVLWQAGSGLLETIEGPSGVLRIRVEQHDIWTLWLETGRQRFVGWTVQPKERHSQAGKAAVRGAAMAGERCAVRIVLRGAPPSGDGTPKWERRDVEQPSGRMRARLGARVRRSRALHRLPGGRHPPRVRDGQVLHSAVGRGERRGARAAAAGAQGHRIARGDERRRPARGVRVVRQDGARVGRAERPRGDGAAGGPLGGGVVRGAERRRLAAGVRLAGPHGARVGRSRRRRGARGAARALRHGDERGAGRGRRASGVGVGGRDGKTEAFRNVLQRCHEETNTLFCGEVSRT